MHLVGVVMGWDDYYALCEHCLLRAGPFEDVMDAELEFLWDEHITSPRQDQ